MHKRETIVVGGGPGGLTCATRLAERGREVLLLERNPVIGPKVCAGGVTWSGFSRHLPTELIEREFPEQHIRTSWQRTAISAAEPIICTVDRSKLGQWMLERALKAGVEVRTGCPVLKVERDRLVTREGSISFSNLVGADGSSSLVRRALGLATEWIGAGINCQLPLELPRMEWHLVPELFNTGYAWIFPHRHSASVGAYACRLHMDAKTLEGAFHTWLAEQGLDLEGVRPRAALINFDYRGIRFGNFFLVGDAAGLASGLTGEGIYPAILSGRAVADAICDRTNAETKLKSLIKKQAQHTKVVQFSSRSKTACKVVMEALVLALRCRLLHFSALEMGDNQ